MTLGIVLSTERDVEAVVALVAAARRRGIEVGIFLMDHGVKAVERLEAFVDECDVVLCGTSVDLYRVKAPDGVVVGSQDDHAALVAKADRVVAFT
jgi:hypothetical protein